MIWNWCTCTRIVCLTLVGGLTVSASAAKAPSSKRPQVAFEQVNLVSDQANVAQFVDPNLVNAWGLAFLAGGPLWVADNGMGVSTVYANDGTPFPSAASPLVVTVPPPNGSPAGTTSTPTGLVANPTTGFVVTANNQSAPARFIFVTEDGTVAGWNPNVDPVNAILVVNPQGGSVYKGATIACVKGSARLYVTNFHNFTIDVFDDQFKPVNVPGGFTDSTIPEGFAPFNIKNIGNRLYVTYALQQPGGHDDQAGPGNGFINIFDKDGNLIRRLLSNGPLNSPWGLALVPHGVKSLKGALLVGNFGDGHITAVDRHTGDIIGQLVDNNGQTIVIDGLWSLVFRQVETDSDVNDAADLDKHDGNREDDSDDCSDGPEMETRLYFTAGPNDEADGLLGFLRAVD